MNQHPNDDCARFEAMMGDWFDESLSATDRRSLDAHVATCAECRASFVLSTHMEEALVSRRAEVPAVDAFLPAPAPAPSRAAHPHLVRAFRALMSPAGIATVLVIWSAMLTLRFRESIGDWLTRVATERLGPFSQNLSNVLLELARGDMVTLIGIYVVLTLIVLVSTGAITLRYIRNS